MANAVRDFCMTVSVTFKICKSLICDVKAFTEICLVCLCLPGWCQCSVCLGPEGYRCTGIRVSLLAFNFYKQNIFNQFHFGCLVFHSGLFIRMRIPSGSWF